MDDPYVGERRGDKYRIRASLDKSTSSLLAEHCYLTNSRPGDIAARAIEYYLRTQTTQSSAEYTQCADEWTGIGLSADWHIGSVYCNPDHCREWQETLLDCGVRYNLIAGDWLEGAYYGRGGQHECEAVGLDQQIDLALDRLDSRLEHYLVDGNHEATYRKIAGLTAGEHLVAVAERFGREGIHYLGADVGHAYLAGLDIELVHYRRGVLRSPQQYLQHRQDRDLPDVLLGGHYHLLDLQVVRGVTCVQPGAIQSETPFMRGSAYHPVSGVILWTRPGYRPQIEIVLLD